MSNNLQICVGDTVISSSFGLGTIISIEYSDAMQSDCFVISNIVSGGKILVPISQKKRIRHPSTQEEMLSSLEHVRSGKEFAPFPSKKDRVNFFKDVLKKAELFEMAGSIGALSRYKDTGKVEEKILEDLIAFYTLELAFGLKVAQDEAFQKVMLAIGKEIK